MEEPAGDVTSRAGRDRTPPWRGGRGCLGLDPTEPSEQTQCRVLFQTSSPKKPILGIFAVPESTAGEGWKMLLGEEGGGKVEFGTSF